MTQSGPYLGGILKDGINRLPVAQEAVLVPPSVLDCRCSLGRLGLGIQLLDHIW
jgi:hypothetical protein